jgi:hypothetical protein
MNNKKVTNYIIYLKHFDNWIDRDARSVYDLNLQYEADGRNENFGIISDMNNGLKQ